MITGIFCSHAWVTAAVSGSGSFGDTMSTSTFWDMKFCTWLTCVALLWCASVIGSSLRFLYCFMKYRSWMLSCAR